MVFARLNDSGICVTVSTVPDEIAELYSDASYVRIDEHDSDYLYRKFSGGTWSEEKYLPEDTAIEVNRVENLEERQSATEEAINFLLGL